MDMETSPELSEKRPRLGPFGRVAVFCLLAIGLLALVGSFAISGQVDEFTFVVMAIGIVPGLLMVTGWRWATVLVAVLTTLLSVVVVLFLGPSLSFPHDPEFLVGLPLMVLMLVAAIASWGASFQKLRKAEQRKPGWLNYALVGIAGLLVGALAVGLIPPQGSVAGISQDVLVDLPEVTTQEFSYNQGTIRVKAGETVALRLDNHDSSAHTFDIDELDVHAPMPGKESSLALFRPTETGTYTFYCAIPGHANLQDGTGMVGTLIVESAS